MGAPQVREAVVKELQSEQFMRFTAIVAILLGFSSCAQEKDFDKMLNRLLSHSVSEINPNQLKAMTNHIILDAREKEEFQVSHIPGAIEIGYDDFKLNNLPKMDPQKRIVVYCSVGYRSEKIAEKLKKAGYADVSNLRGGIFQWVNEGNPVVNENGETPAVHTYNKSWSKWLLKGEKTW